MKRPSDTDIRAFLEEYGELSSTSDRGVNTWLISGHFYKEARALEVAETCLLTGQTLSAVTTTPLALNLARRLADLEEIVAGLKTNLEEGFTS